MENFTCVEKCGTGFFQFGFTCVTLCPDGTKDSIVNDTLICELCDGPCVRPTIGMETKVVNDGKSLETKVDFPSGLHPNNTVASMKESVKLWLVLADSRRLLADEN